MLLHHLIESSVTPLNMTEPELIDFIQKNCQPYIKELGGFKPLYRGIGREMPPVFIKAPRIDRKPFSSPDEAHMLFNTIIKMSGKIANRSNSFFTSSNTKYIEGYGEPYIIIPIGNFNYTWSRKHLDWFLIADMIREKVDVMSMDLEFLNAEELKNVQHHLQKYASTRPEIAQIAELERKITKPGVENFEIQQYEKEISELKSMMRFDIREYSQSYKRKKILDKINKNDPKLIQKFIKLFNLEISGDDGTLAEAMKSGYEIMLHCEYALFISLKVAQLRKLDKKLMRL